MSNDRERGSPPPTEGAGKSYVHCGQSGALCRACTGRYGTGPPTDHRAVSWMLMSLSGAHSTCPCYCSILVQKLVEEARQRGT